MLVSEVLKWVLLHQLQATTLTGTQSQKPTWKKETERPIQINFNPQHIACVTMEHLSGGTMFHNDDTTFQNDTALTATHATVAPAAGDLICKVTLSAGSVGFAVTIGYHTL